MNNAEGPSAAPENERGNLLRYTVTDISACMRCKFFDYGYVDLSYCTNDKSYVQGQNPSGITFLAGCAAFEADPHERYKKDASPAFLPLMPAESHAAAALAAGGEKRMIQPLSLVSEQFRHHLWHRRSMNAFASSLQKLLDERNKEGRALPLTDPAISENGSKAMREQAPTAEATDNQALAQERDALLATVPPAIAAQLPMEIAAYDRNRQSAGLPLMTSSERLILERAVAERMEAAEKQRKAREEFRKKVRGTSGD